MPLAQGRGVWSAARRMGIARHAPAAGGPAHMVLDDGTRAAPAWDVDSYYRKRRRHPMKRLSITVALLPLLAFPLMAGAGDQGWMPPEWTATPPAQQTSKTG